VENLLERDFNALEGGAQNGSRISRSIATLEGKLFLCECWDLPYSKLVMAGRCIIAKIGQIGHRQWRWPIWQLRVTGRSSFLHSDREKPIYSVDYQRFPEPKEPRLGCSILECRLGHCWR